MQCFRSFHTTERTIEGVEAMHMIRKGQVEGQVNQLKLLKREVYGRAKFDLLRARVLYAG